MQYSSRKDYIFLVKLKHKSSGCPFLGNEGWQLIMKLPLLEVIGGIVAVSCVSIIFNNAILRTCDG